MANVKKMARAKATVIYLDASVLETIKADALSEGISMAEWIRFAVAERLKRRQRKGVQS
jgi:hypothetical protein